MTNRTIILAVVIGIAAAAAAWWQVAPPAPAPPLEPRHPQETAPATAPRTMQPERGMQASAEVFRERVRSFLDSAERMDPQARGARATALREVILARERDGDLLPGESAYLQLAVLRVTVLDEDALHRRSQALLAEYQARSDAGWEAYRERPDVRHQAYRAAEAELVRRATEGPDPLPQDELRERLQALREQYFDDGALQ